MEAILKSNGNTGIIEYNGMFYFIKNANVVGSAKSIPSTFTALISFEIPSDMDLSIKCHIDYISNLNAKKQADDLKAKQIIADELKAKFHGKKLRVFESERITKCDKSALKSFNVIADSYHSGTVQVVDSVKRGRHFDYSTKEYNGVFYVKSNEIYHLGTGLIVSSRKKNYNALYKEISLQDFKKQARKLWLEKANNSLQAEIIKFNTELTKYAVNFISNL